MLPFESTVATFLLLLVHVTDLLAASAGSTVAVSFPVSPRFSVSVSLSSLTPDTFGASTVSLQTAVKPPSAVFTVIFAVPTLSVLMLPLESTVATFLLLLVHVTDLLPASVGFTVAVSLALSPRFRVSVDLSSVTPETLGAVTVTLQTALSPPSSVVAVIVVSPTLTALIVPFASTVAIFLSALLHKTFLFFAVSGRTVAVNFTLLPFCTVMVFLLSVMLSGVVDT